MRNYAKSPHTISMPVRTPEGRLIGDAQKQRDLSSRQAAQWAGISPSRWTQIVNGYQIVSGKRVPVTDAPADTIARMAEVVGVTADELRGAGRDDAAGVLTKLRLEFTPKKSARIAEIARGQLDPALRRFTNYDLLMELHLRQVAMAGRLHALGDETLAFVAVQDGGDIIVTARPVNH